MAFQATCDWESASGKHFAKEIPKPILTPKETRPSKNKGCSLTFLFGFCLFFHCWREYTSQWDSHWGTPRLCRLYRLSPKAQWGLAVGARRAHPASRWRCQALDPGLLPHSAQRNLPNVRPKMNQMLPDDRQASVELSATGRHKNSDLVPSPIILKPWMPKEEIKPENVIKNNLYF